MRFEKEYNRFLPEFETVFEKHAQAQHPKFGRVMLWILFSTGAEYFLKSSFLLGGIWTPTVRSKQGIPPRHFSSNGNFREAVNALPSEDVKDFLTMGRLINRFDELFALHSHTSEYEKETVKNAYTILANVIRNRDSHAYVEHVREGQFSVTNILCPAFNTLLSWVNNSDLVQALNVQTVQTARSR